MESLASLAGVDRVEYRVRIFDTIKNEYKVECRRQNYNRNYLHPLNYTFEYLVMLFLLELPKKAPSVKKQVKWLN